MTKTTDRNVNPRGAIRPQDGRGQGVGVTGGLRVGRNIGPCSNGGPGFSRGGGRGAGRNRR